MKIAVTYENGEIFQHFGHTKEFKVYTVEDNKVVSSEILGAGGSGHEALAYLLSEHQIQALICGGIGGGAQAALEDAGVELCAGQSGPADEVVEAYLRGELINTGANCNHHGHGDGGGQGHEHGEGNECGHGDGSGHGHEHGEGNECGHGEGNDHGHGEGHDHGHGEGHECGHDCGSGCGGCHKPAFEGPNVGKTVRTHYRGTFNDGTEFDSSYKRGEPLEFICGAGMMIPGFDKAVATMKLGEKINVHLMAEEAYGPVYQEAIFTIDVSEMPGAEDLRAGEKVWLTSEYGRQIPATVTAREGTSITFDTNHEMAGKELNFEIELIETI